MAFAKTITTVLSNKTAAASSSTTLSDCTTAVTTDYLNLAILVRLTFNASATLGARVKAFASNDDSTYNTYPFWQADISYLSGAQAQAFQLPSGPKYLKFQVTNLDTGQSITAIYIDTHAQNYT
jgi:hypothetical protein